MCLSPPPDWDPSGQGSLVTFLCLLSIWWKTWALQPSASAEWIDPTSRMVGGEEKPQILQYASDHCFLNVRQCSMVINSFRPEFLPVEDNNRVGVRMKWANRCKVIRIVLVHSKQLMVAILVTVVICIITPAHARAHTHELSNVYIERTLWLWAAHNLFSFLQVVSPSSFFQEPYFPYSQPAWFGYPEPCSLVPARDPDLASQESPVSWLQLAPWWAHDPSRANETWSLWRFWEEELLSPAKLAEFSLQLPVTMLVTSSAELTYTWSPKERPAESQKM